MNIGWISLFGAMALLIVHVRIKIKYTIIIIISLNCFPDSNTTISKSLISFTLKDQPDIEHIVARVEWTTLIFFATLFVIMKSLDKLGFLLWIGGEITNLIQIHYRHGRRYN